MLYRPMSRTRDFAKRVWLRFPWTQQFARYASVGLINMILFYTLFNILLTFRWPTLVAYVVSLFIAALNSFAFNKFWAFGDSSRERMTQQFVRFVLWSLVTLGLGTAGVWVLLIPLAQYGRIGRNLAALLVAPVTVAGNFIAYRRWTFAPRAVDSRRA